MMSRMGQVGFVPGATLRTRPCALGLARKAARKRKRDQTPALGVMDDESTTHGSLFTRRLLTHQVCRCEGPNDLALHGEGEELVRPTAVRSNYCLTSG